MRMRAVVSALGLLAGAACLSERAMAPRGSAPAPMTAEEYAAACNHAPGARMRLYGCARNQPEPLYVVDGRRLPRGDGWRARRRREGELRAARQRAITAVVVIAPRDTAALAPYGAAGRHGVILITTETPRGR